MWTGSWWEVDGEGWGRVERALGPLAGVIARNSGWALCIIRFAGLLLVWYAWASAGRRSRVCYVRPCIIMEEQGAVVSLVLSRHNVFFQGGRQQSLGKSVVIRTLRKEQSCRWWWENFCRNVLPLPQDWLADLPRSSLAKCSRTTKPLNRLGL